MSSKADYVEWFKPFAAQVFRVLKGDGSFVLNIGGSWNEGAPTRSLYQYKLLIALVEEIGFHLAQECYWYNPAKMPVPAEWVTVRRVRVKDSVEHVWWLSKSKHPKASNLKVLKPYSADMLRLNARGLRETVRPSGHVINKSWDKMHDGGAIPGNVIEEQLPDDMLKFRQQFCQRYLHAALQRSRNQDTPSPLPVRTPGLLHKNADRGARCGTRHFRGLQYRWRHSRKSSPALDCNGTERRISRCEQVQISRLTHIHGSLNGCGASTWIRKPCPSLRSVPKASIDANGGFPTRTEAPHGFTRLACTLAIERHCWARVQNKGRATFLEKKHFLLENRRKPVQPPH